MQLSVGQVSAGERGWLETPWGCCPDACCHSPHRASWRCVPSAWRTAELPEHGATSETRPALHPSDSGLDATAVWLSRQQGLRVPWDRAWPPATGLCVGTHGKAAMAASRVNTAVLSLAGPTHEKGAGAGSRCLRQNSVGDSPGGGMPSGRSALEETKRQGVCPSM